jgi:hypothetical protein
MLHLGFVMSLDPTYHGVGMVLEEAAHQIVVITDSSFQLSVVGQKETGCFDPAHTKDEALRVYRNSPPRKGRGSD